MNDQENVRGQINLSEPNFEMEPYTEPEGVGVQKLRWSADGNCRRFEDTCSKRKGNREGIMEGLWRKCGVAYIHLPENPLIQNAVN